MSAAKSTITDRLRGGALRTRRSRIVAVVALAVAVSLVATLILREVLASDSSGSGALRLYAVRATTVSAAMSGTGTVVPAMQTNLGFRSSGQLVEIDVHVGDHVAKGQVLARLDSSSQRSQLVTAQAGLQSAQASLQTAESPLSAAQLTQLQHAVSNARQSYDDTVGSTTATSQQDAASVAADRAQLSSDQAAFNTDGCAGSSPPDPGRCSADQQAVASDQSRLTTDENRQQSDSISNQSRLHQAQQQITAAADALSTQSTVKPTALLAAQAQLASAQAGVTTAQTALDSTTLTAPMDGVITAVNGQVGETAGAGGGTTAQAPGSTAPLSSGSASGTGGSSSGSTAFMTLEDTSAMAVIVPFAEADAAKVTANMPATVTFDALSDVTAIGHVVSVASTATTVSNVVEYNTTVALDSGDSRVRTGMTATISVEAQRRDNVLAVPSTALHGSGANTTVTVLRNGVQTVVAVQTGLVGDTLTEITSGLSAGDQVVLPALRTGTTTATGTGGGIFGGGGLTGGGRGPGR